MKIEIARAGQRLAEPGIYVGRPGPYGNPYPVSRWGRERAIAKFDRWFHAPAQAGLRRRAVEEIHDGSCLLCFCGHRWEDGENFPPVVCHAQVIARWVLAVNAGYIDDDLMRSAQIGFDGPQLRLF